MKKIVSASALLVFLFFVASTTYAQFSQGTKTLGGGIGFEVSNQDNATGIDFKYRHLDLNFSGGFLLQDNVEAGLMVGFNSSKNSSDDEDANGMTSSIKESRSGIFSIGPFVRLYNPITDVVGLFGQADFNVGFGGERIDWRSGPTTQNRMSYLGIGIQPGVILMVNENLGLEAMIGRLGYSRSASGDKDNYEDTRYVTNSFRASFDLRDISFGFRLYLRD